MRILAFTLLNLLVMWLLLPWQVPAASARESETGPAVERALAYAHPAHEVGRICAAPLVHPAEILPLDIGGEHDEDSVEAVVPSGNTDLGGQESLEAGAGVEPPPAMVSQPIFLEVDKNARILAERDRALSLGPLSLDEEHLIKVREHDKIVQAFLVSFQGANPRELCVFYHEAKQAWVVVPMDEVTAWCSCDHSAYVPPPSDEEQLELENQTDETDRRPADSKGETSR